jgi:excisionase family DNA binding protein
LEERLLDIRELSNYLAIKRSTLYSKIGRGEIPFYKIGNLVRFRQSEIDEWLHRAKCDPAGPRPRPKARSKVQKNGKGTPYASAVRAMVTEAIADSRKVEYTRDYGKPDRTKGPGREVENAL